MSPNQYVSDLRAEVAALRAVVARVEEVTEAQYRSAWAAWATTVDGGEPSRTLWARVNQALEDQQAVRAVLGSTDSDPAATERQGTTEGASDGV